MRGVLLLAVLLAGCDGKKDEARATRADEAPPPVAPATFSTSDPLQSLRWFAGERRKIQDTVRQGNELSIEAGRVGVEQLCRSFSPLNANGGRAVRWELALNGVRADGGCEIAPLSWEGPKFSSGTDEVRDVYRLYVAPAKTKVKMPAMWPIPAADKGGWLKRLAQGDKVLVTGTTCWGHHFDVFTTDGGHLTRFTSLVVELENPEVRQRP